MVESQSWKLSYRIIAIKPGIRRTDDFRVLFGRHTEGRIKKGRIGFPGGGAEAGETPAETIQREGLEEIGVPLVLLNRHVEVVDLPERNARLFYVLTAAAPGAVPSDQPAEGFVEVRYIRPARLLARRDDVLMPNDVLALRNMSRAGIFPGQANFRGWGPIPWESLPRAFSPQGQSQAA